LYGRELSLDDRARIELFEVCHPYPQPGRLVSERFHVKELRPSRRQHLRLLSVEALDELRVRDLVGVARVHALHVLHEYDLVRVQAVPEQHSRRVAATPTQGRRLPADGLPEEPADNGDLALR